ncbi:MAG: GldG family protein [Myxococcales bacterium]|nr:GldG family protein [Myxococcales bacterium]
MRRGALTAAATVALLALAAAQLVWLAEQNPVRIDLTADARHTLAPITRALVAEAEAPIEIRAFLPSRIQPPYRASVVALADVLDALAAEGARVVVRDPSDEGQDAAALDEEAAGYGIPKVAVAETAGDRRVRRELRFGVAVLYHDRQAVVGPVAVPADAEYAVARALHTAIRGGGRPVIGVAEGHGEPDIVQSPLATLLAPLGEVQPVAIDGRPLPPGLDLVLIVAPTKPFDARARYVLDQHLMRGGAVVALLDYRPASTVFPDVLVPVTTGLEPLLAHHGLVIDTDRAVVDRARPMPAPIGRDANGRVITVDHPLYPLIRDLAQDHPVTRGLQSLVTPLAAPIALRPPKGAHAAALARSGPGSVTRTEVRALDPASVRAAPAAGDKAVEAPGPAVVAAAVEGVLSSAFSEADRPPPPAVETPFGGAPRPEPPFLASGQREARLLVVTSGGRMLAAQENALLLLQNAVEWAVTAGALAELRARAAEDPPLDETTAATRTRVKLAALVGPTLLLLMFGAARRWRRRAR